MVDRNLSHSNPQSHKQRDIVHGSQFVGSQKKKRCEKTHVLFSDLVVFSYKNVSNI